MDTPAKDSAHNSDRDVASATGTDSQLTPGKRPRKTRSRFVRLLRFIWLVMTVGVAAATVVAATSPMINPEVTTLPSMMAMGFPFLIVADVLLGLVNLFISRRTALVQWVAMMVSIPAIGNWFPAHPFRGTPEIKEGERLVRFMSYNTFDFNDDEQCYPDSTNRTASSIIHSGADIICLQEVGKLADIPHRCLTDEQIDSINDIYPYFASEDEKMVSILSKYPMREIYLDQPPSPHSGWQAAEVVVGPDTLLVVSVHMQSFGLDDEDKELYHSITGGNVSRDMTDAGKVIYRKLAGAFRLRASQARLLRQQLDSLNYRNVLLSGDFNDIAGSYPMRTIRGKNMKSVFRTIGTGPVITYHSDRFLFNIDHVIYQGCLRPLLYRRGAIKSSDHYPVYVTFAI